MRTSYEQARGCGRRKPGGLYLVSDGVGQDCDLLPVELHVCPTCSAGIKPSRGWTWVNPDELLPHHAAYPSDFLEEVSNVHPGCPLNEPGLLGERAGLLWIGEAFYKTPHDWIAEGQRMGFSRRISAVPRGFELGETWVLAAHRKAIVRFPDGLSEPEFTPAIFHVWKPARVEYVVKGDETEEQIAAIEARGIEPVIVKPAYEPEELVGRRIP